MSGAVVAKHKFDQGQRVHLTGGARRAGQASSERFTITRQMPADRQGFVYRIKGDSEPHERVVQEAVLEAVNW
jgi:hypothetical protein